MRSHRREHVVRVHNDVHEGVEQAEEGGMAAGRELHSEPDRHRHHSVVNDVECRHVVKLFSEHKEDLPTNFTVQ